MKKMIVVLSVMSLFVAAAVFAGEGAAAIKGKVTKEGDKIVCVGKDGKKCELPADKAELVGKEVICKCDKDGKVVEVKACPPAAAKACGEKKTDEKK
ncbi:MAG: hypothetical protein A2X49_08040 [Lentisphaerae bacterium GWF2_52_8]|nr:MAG: hypothetical protein A2X49_08040 [Lentisphaerae bacterium GWF2_52_8]